MSLRILGVFQVFRPLKSTTTLVLDRCWMPWENYV